MFQENVLLKEHSNYKIGGLAKYFFEAKSVEEIIKAIEMARKMRVPVFVLGGGTNILFSDEGFNGLILKPNIQFIDKIENVAFPTLVGKTTLLRIGAGISMVQFLNDLMAKGLSGLEWAAGIPGTVGGAIHGNAGAFGGEMKDIIKEVISLDISGSRPKIIKRNNLDCKFNYRSSIFKRQSEIILEATLILKRGDRELIETVIKRNIDYRKERQPMEYPSLGSTFKNVPLTQIDVNNIRVNPRINPRKSAFPIKTDSFPVIPAAYLISEAGLKGISSGGAMISPKHPNFIVNVMAATSNDVKNLIALSKNKVYDKFKIKLEEEITYLV